MNQNFTSLRTIVLIALFSLAFNSSFAQSSKNNDQVVTNFKAEVVNDKLNIDWNISESANTNYCEVQGSKDGKNFSTIGLVLGADPTQTGNAYKFKQNISKMKPGLVYYRVVTILNNGSSTSETIHTAK